MHPTIYLITHHQFNHEAPGRLPLDPRFLNSSHNYVYYLVDQTVPACLKEKQILIEKEIDPLLHYAGGHYLGEWSFLLAEAKHQFCSYPFFMISSRFYEKNQWLPSSLDCEWNQLFQYLKAYRFGFLPSYNRPLRWIDLSWEKKITEAYQRHYFFPFRQKAFELIHESLGVLIPQNYRYTA